MVDSNEICWESIKVGDLGRIVTGKTPKTSQKENYGGVIPFITPSDDMNVKFLRNTSKTLTEIGASSVRGSIIPKGSICVSCIGSDLGKVVITTETSVTNQQINSIIVDESRFDIDYVYYAMLILGKVLNHNSKTSTAVPIVNKSSFSNYSIPCPDLNTQKKISSVLASFDAKIENNNQINGNLEQQALEIFDDMFSDVSAGNKLIGDIITPKRGKGLLSKDAVFGDAPVVAGGLEPATYHNIANTTSPVLTISASGANAGFVNLWNIPVWSSDSSFIDADMTNDVYFWYVMLKKRQQEIFDAQTGSAQPHIYPKHIAAMPIVELEQEDITQFTSIVTPMFQTIGENKKQNTKLAELRDSLLPRLMSGKLDVSNIAI